MKILLFTLFVTSLNATVLFLGDNLNKFKCDGEIYTPIKMVDCTKIEAIDEISFCYFKDSNLGCKKLQKNDKYSIDSSDDNPINFKRLLGFNKVEQTSFGIKRFGDKTTKDSFFPNGTILKPKTNLIIKIHNSNKKEKLTLFKNETIIFKTNIKNNQIVIPKSKFKYEQEYQWVLNDGDNEYKGVFDILDKETEIYMNNELKKLTQNIRNEITKKQITSIIYDQYSLKYDRYIILKD